MAFCAFYSNNIFTEICRTKTAINYKRSSILFMSTSYWIPSAPTVSYYVRSSHASSFAWHLSRVSAWLRADKYPAEVKFTCWLHDFVWIVMLQMSRFILIEILFFVGSKIFIYSLDVILITEWLLTRQDWFSFVSGTAGFLWLLMS